MAYLSVLVAERNKLHGRRRGLCRRSERTRSTWLTMSRP
jgi:hypothetical protein